MKRVEWWRVCVGYLYVVYAAFQADYVCIAY
jgi:hypothetical protein